MAVSIAGGGGYSYVGFEPSLGFKISGKKYLGYEEIVGIVLFFFFGGGGVITKLNFGGGVISIHFRAFLMSRYRTGIVFGPQNFK